MILRQTLYVLGLVLALARCSWFNSEPENMALPDEPAGAIPNASAEVPVAPAVEQAPEGAPPIPDVDAPKDLQGVQEIAVQKQDAEDMTLPAAQPLLLAEPPKSVATEAELSFQDTEIERAKAAGDNEEVYWVKPYTLNVRTRPSNTSKSDKILRKGDKVKVLERRGTWVRIGKDEWVSQQYLIKAK